MASGMCCTPPLFRHRSRAMEASRGSTMAKNQAEGKGLTAAAICQPEGSYILLGGLKKKILAFRDINDLTPHENAASVNELVIRTIWDLHKLYPEIIQCNFLPEMKGWSLAQGLVYFCKCLRSLANSWARSHEFSTLFKPDMLEKMENYTMDRIVSILGETLDYMIKSAEERFDVMDIDDQPDSPASSIGGSPVTPTSVLPETTENSAKDSTMVSYTPAFLYPLRVQAVGKLNPIDVKSLSIHILTNVADKDSSLLIQKSKTDEEPNDSSPLIQNNETIEELKPETEAQCNFETTWTMVIGDYGNVKESTEFPVSNLNEAGNFMLPSNITPPIPPPPPPAPSPLRPQRDAPMGPAPPPLPPSPLRPYNVVPAIPPLQPSPLRSENVVPAGPLPPPPPPFPVKASGTGIANAPPPPPPPMFSSKGLVSMAPPSMTKTKGGVPPPPPTLGAAKSLRAKKGGTKLRRSTQMGSLYRLLKGKVEGCDQDPRSPSGKKCRIGSSTSGKQGMADALAEITKRSAYFQQIEDDAQKYAKSIMELKASISSFQTKDMAELLKFHKHVESNLENLTDETQVLARFEGFPAKKLESLRSAAALYKRLNAILNELENWKIVAPLSQLLDRVERYFNKIKGEIDALERTKDEESKKFQCHNIHFDFHILVRIKESMVDVSSSCMELALKEKREVKAMAAASKNEGPNKASAKMLWRAFQLAFRVYTFAGGHDDRADMLSRELAKEIETDP